MREHGFIVTLSPDPNAASDTASLTLPRHSFDCFRVKCDVRLRSRATVKRPLLSPYRWHVGLSSLIGWKMRRNPLGPLLKQIGEDRRVTCAPRACAVHGWRSKVYTVAIFTRTTRLISLAAKEVVVRAPAQSAHLRQKPTVPSLQSQSWLMRN